MISGIVVCHLPVLNLRGSVHVLCNKISEVFAFVLKLVGRLNFQ